MARTGYPCAPKLNPFSYEERVAMLTLPLDAFDIPNHRYSFIPFPSDYKNLSALIPCDAVFLMSTTSNNDAKKIAHIESLGYKTKSIITIPPDQERHRSGAVRDSATAGTDWKTMVHPAIADYIEKNKLETKLAQSSKLKA
jgi:nicotinamide mononucleotide adenylyltransferase